MPKRILTVFAACLLQVASLWSQCITKDSLLHRLALLKSNPSMPAADQLKELLRYEAGIAQCPYRNDSTHEILLRRITSLYRQQSDYAHAAFYLNKACELIANNYSSLDINRPQLVTNYYFLSVCYDSLRNASEKRRAENNCIEWAKRQHILFDISAIRCLFALAEYMFDIGDYQRCFDNAQLCGGLSRQYLATPGSNIAIAGDFVRSSHGWCVESLLRLEEFEKAEKMLTNKAAEYKKSGRSSYLAFIYEELAEVLLHKGDHDNALRYFNLALQYYKAEGAEFTYKQTLKTMGEELYFGYFNDAPKALAYYRMALQHNRPPADRARIDSIEDANILNSIANVYVQQNNFDSAFVFFCRAFNLVKPGSDETGILRSSEEIGNYKKMHYLASLLIDKADAWRKKYTVTGDKHAVDEAARVYRVADQMLGRINTQQSDFKSRLFWRKDSRRLYEHAIDLHFLQGNADAAFYFFEKSRAVLLNDQLNAQRMQGDETIARQGTVRRQLLQLGRGLDSTDPGSPRYAALRTALYAARQELDSLEQKIKAQNPLYYQVYLDSSYTRLEDVRKTLLTDHPALLELFYGDSAVYALLVTDKHSWLDRIDKKVYDSTVQRYMAYLGDHTLLNRDFGGYVRTANNLYRLIFHDHPLPPGRLIVSPDGRSFPLESLVTHPSVTNPVYMLSNYAVSYTYSARYLLNNFEVNTSAAAGNFLGVAPVQFPGTRLAALEGSDVSLQHIGEYFSGSLNLVSADATRERFRREFPSYRIIQLYTHASDSSDNKEPVIHFADSVMYLSDLIPESRPLARLIVLSACETANGRFYRGEGVFSFNRGFAAMGIPASVSNLWSVDNNATYRITELFYQYLSKGLPADLALQKAKLDFIATADTYEQQLPYYWAASIVIGKADAIYHPRPSPWWWLAGSAVIVLLALLVFRMYKRKSLLESI